MRNLVRARFVPVMYDVAPPGRNAGDAWAYDQDAVDVISDIDRLQRGRAAGGSQEPNGKVRAGSYPAALFVLPDGTMLGDGLWGILPPERMVAELQRVIARWPEHFPACAAELAVLQAAEQHPGDVAAQLAAAQLSWELADFDAVLRVASPELVAQATGSTAGVLSYLRGRALLCLGRDNEARHELEAAAASLAGDELAAVHVACARLDMRAGEPEQALQRLLPMTQFERPGRWTGAAMYYAGLCYHRLGDEVRSKQLWRRHREQLPYDRLARRSAGSLGLPEAEAFLNQELLEQKGWW
ncbi:MAG TPA: hypothetical protein VFZ65_14040 [Planctomycetota bacterium]|nr:hypothetical protein [Planctomycetota bacterium]